MPEDSCPECAKVILNGGIAARVLDETCHTIYEYLEAGHTFKDADIKELVVLANKLEDDAFAFQKKVLEGIGFKGPWPKSMA